MVWRNVNRLDERNIYGTREVRLVEARRPRSDRESVAVVRQSTLTGPFRVLARRVIRPGLDARVPQHESLRLPARLRAGSVLALDFSCSVSDLSLIHI